jgi:hypothetical protein
MVSFTATLRAGGSIPQRKHSANTAQTQPNLFKQLRQDNFLFSQQTLKYYFFELTKTKIKTF